ncbi:YndJ family protein [Actinoplanes nipponensis]|uniref:YndJ family protein n=1 Tax=Actinoplanes nipponensis TaxID=135950 RepID=UPI0019404339|nr:YndJ family protein [Actinoplanes nipponensis]
MRVLVNLLVTVGMLVVVPAGLRLIGDPAVALARRCWPVGAVAGAVSLWLPRGTAATGLATVYACAAAVLCAYAVSRPVRPRREWPVEAAVLTALISPAVAASALVAERAGYQLFGFELGILALTVAHFHFAGFAAALIAGLQGRLAGHLPAGRVAADAAALTVPAGTLLVLLGYFTAEAVELAGALVLTAGMWTVGWLTWRYARTAPDRLTALLLGCSAAVLAASMVLAVSWALGEATGLPHPSLAWMAATHGVANALGFAVCAMVGWRRAGAYL